MRLMCDTYEAAGVSVDIVFGNRPPELANITFAANQACKRDLYHKRKLRTSLTTHHRSKNRRFNSQSICIGFTES
jgi:hypothetical protein